MGLFGMPGRLLPHEGKEVRSEPDASCARSDRWALTRTDGRSPPRGELGGQIGIVLRRLRVARGLSQAELGEPYFTRAHVSAIELGKTLPALSTLGHFARKLKTPLRDLVPPD